MADSKGQQPEFEDLDSLEELNLSGPTNLSPPEEGVGAEAPSEATPLDLSESGELPEGFGQLDGGLSPDSGTTEAVPALAAAAIVPDVDQVQDVTADAGIPAADAEPIEAQAEEPEKKAQTWLAYVEWVGVALVITAVYLLFSFLPATAGNALWHSCYWVMMGLVPYIVWKTRKYWQTPEVTAPYTVMLAVALMALFTAVFLLGLELAQYGWDIKAKNKDLLSRAAVTQIAEPYASPEA